MKLEETKQSTDKGYIVKKIKGGKIIKVLNDFASVRINAPTTFRGELFFEYRLMEFDKDVIIYLDGQDRPHREDGPAIYFNDHREWWVNGQFVKED
jgi:hypothetical protein